MTPSFDLDMLSYYNLWIKVDEILPVHPSTLVQHIFSQMI